MQETNRIDSAETTESLVRINVPHYGIDLRVILLGLRYELVTQDLCFSHKIEKHGDNVIVPTLRQRFTTKPINGYLVVHCRKKIKIPILLDGELLSVRCVDVLADFLEKKQVNYPMLLPSPTHEHTVRLQTSRLVSLEPSLLEALSAQTS
jgi:hypothetical protein